MKKLLMLGAILALGVTTMAEPITEEKGSAPVYLQAEITSENLIISGIDGRDILLDFGKINKNTQNNRGAEAKFKVEYVGTQKTNNPDLKLELERRDVKMSHTTNSEAVQMTANLRMVDTLGTSFTNTTQGIEGTAKIENITAKGEIYQGQILGVLKTTEIANGEVGMYEGATQLNVTLNGTKSE